MTNNRCVNVLKMEKITCKYWIGELYCKGEYVESFFAQTEFEVIDQCDKKLGVRNFVIKFDD